MKKIDASGKILGRLATEIADTIRGKNNPEFSPNRSDCGEEVEIINADKIIVTGRKKEQKKYYDHPNTRPGALKTISLKKLMSENNYEEIIERAIKGMLPKNKLQKIWLTKIKFSK